MKAQASPLPQGGLAAVASVSDSAYFLDVDGTFLEIRPTPQEVAAGAAERALIAGLAKLLGGALALVSGRALPDVDRIFAPLIFAAAGLHGAEMRFPDGSRIEASGALMDGARPKLRAFAAAHQGVMLEDKGASLAVHFRQRPELETEVFAALAEAARDPDLTVQAGKMVAELKPARADKGAAVAAFLEHPPFKGRRPVFIGDDLTDEKGFAFVNGRGGVSLRIGPEDEMTKAQFRLDDPAALRRELAKLAAGC